MADVGTLASRKMNNLNWLRLLFAFFVLVVHSYDLTGNTDNFLSRAGIPLSAIGVSGFFAISGYLIYKSMLRSKSVASYFKNRLLRLYPALIVCLVLTVVVVWAVYQGSTRSYIDNLSVWSYVPRNLSLIFLQYNIAGVFELNKYPGPINGSLWTLIYEFMMYVGVGILMLFTHKRSYAIKIRRFILVSVSAFMALGWFAFYSSSLPVITDFLITAKILELGSTFLIGALVAEFSLERYFLKGVTFIAAICLLVLSIKIGEYERYAPITMVVISLWVGLKTWQPLVSISERLGDISYGLYIYSFPVQQVLLYEFNLGPIKLLALSSVITALLSYLSWHIVESKFLKLKDVSLISLLKPLKNTFR